MTNIATKLRIVDDRFTPESDPDAEEAKSWQLFWGGIFFCGFIAGLLAVLVPVLVIGWWVA